MLILWKYLKPHRRLAAWSLLLAGLSQVLALVDPIIFGMIIDEYATRRGERSAEELLAGVLWLLAIAVAVAVLSRLAKAVQEYLTRLVVQKFGTQIFNDGLRQTLRLDYQEFADQRSGETLSVLLKVRTDTERFINAFINILFASLVGVGFLVWYSITKHWALVPVFLVGVLLLGGLTGLLSREIKTQQRSIVRETARNSGFITESLRNIELIKSLGLTFPEIRRLQAQTVKVRRPRLLIFDEATSALDSITEEQITETVRRVSALKMQITILIAHRLSTIMHADTIHVLEKGRIVESGDHHTLVDRKGLYYAMWRQQIGERK